MSERASVRDLDVCEDGGRLLGPPPTPRPPTGGSAFPLPVSGVLRSSPFYTRRLPAVPAALTTYPNATARTRAVQETGRHCYRRPGNAPRLAGGLDDAWLPAAER